MVHIDRQKCVGCGTCVETCPYGALYLSRAGHAAVVWSLCQPGCQECLGACERGGITLIAAKQRGRPRHSAGLGASA